MKYPNVWPLYHLIAYVNRGEVMAEVEPYRWAAARPLGFATFRSRCKCAWLVFTGRADALVWPGQ